MNLPALPAMQPTEIFADGGAGVPPVAVSEIPVSFTHAELHDLLAILQERGPAHRFVFDAPVEESRRLFKSAEALRLKLHRAAIDSCCRASGSLPAVHSVCSRESHSRSKPAPADVPARMPAHKLETELYE